MVAVNFNDSFFCLVGVMFLAGSIYTMLICTDCPPFQEYRNSLTPDLLDVYQDVARERNNLYLQGLVLGVVLAMVFLYFSKGSLDVFGNSCVFTGIATAVQYFYYILTPKTVYMLPLLGNQEQVELWHDVYKTMQGRYHLGMLIGFIGYFTLAYGMQRNLSL